jgi:hypothetical protein
MIYKCNICKYASKYTTHYNVHMKSKKHLKKVAENENKKIESKKK